MNMLTFEEQTLVGLYNSGTRRETIQTLTDMQGYLEQDETELRSLTNSAIAKLAKMSDADFEAFEFELLA